MKRQNAYRVLLSVSLASSSLLAIGEGRGGERHAAAVVTSFDPIADATVDAARANSTLGKSERIKVDASPRQRSFFRFELTGLSGDVTQAKLRLFNVNGSGSGGRLVAMTNNSWNERSVTWNNAPRVGSASVSSVAAVSSGLYYEWDATPLIAGNGTVSIALRSGSTNGAAYSSREGPEARSPQLIVTTEVTSPSPTPSTSPSTAPGTVVAAAGNIACDPSDADFNGGLGTSGGGCRFKETSDVVASIGPDAVLPLGDNQYQNGSLANYQSVYDPTWGRFRSISHPAPGNHDYDTPGATGYFTYFGSQAPAPYYSFDLGAWHLISLNSEISKDGGSAQEVWLRQDLATTDKECVLAYWHRPRFSSGPSGGTPTMEPLYRALRDNDVEVLLTAHDHLYERFAPQDAVGNADPSGVRQFVVGTGGKSRHSAQIVKPNSEVWGSAYGALKLTLRQGAFDWRFVAIPTSSFTDSGSDTCH